MTETGFSTSDYAYELPEELIAQDPLPDRAASRLLVLDPVTGEVSHRSFREIGSFLHSGDCLVFNDTRVIPARLLGVKRDTGAAVELLLLKRRESEGGESTASSGNNTGFSRPDDGGALHSCVWECLVRPGKKLRPGAVVMFGGGELSAAILEVLPEGNRLVRFEYHGIFEEVLDALGEMPLPPYITHRLPRENRDRYQTVYARHEGSAAAPTAGLHFTEELLRDLREQGIRTAFLTLDVGLGTFRPVKVRDVREHHMHTERCEIPCSLRSRSSSSVKCSPAVGAAAEPSCLA